MKFLKKLIVVLCILALLAGAVVGGIFWHRLAKQRKADALYAQVCAALAEYPEGFGHTIFYYCGGNTEYLLLKNGEKQISAARSTEDAATYYMDGRAWKSDTDGTLVESGDAVDPVAELARSLTADLLQDSTMTYSYAVAGGSEVPMWVFDGPYLNCQREEYADSFEVMSYKEKTGQLVWDILRTSEDVTLYLYADPMAQEGLRGSIPGWGELDQAISKIILG